MRIISGHENWPTSADHSSPRRYTQRRRSVQPPDDRTYSAEVTAFRRNLLHHRIARAEIPYTRTVIIPPRVSLVKHFFKKIQNILQRIPVKFGDNDDFSSQTHVLRSTTRPLDFWVQAGIIECDCRMNSANCNLAGRFNGKPNCAVRVKGSLWEGAGREAD